MPDGGKTRGFSTASRRRRRLPGDTLIEFELGLSGQVPVRRRPGRPAPGGRSAGGRDRGYGVRLRGQVFPCDMSRQMRAADGPCEAKRSDRNQAASGVRDQRLGSSEIVEFCPRPTQRARTPSSQEPLSASASATTKGATAVESCNPTSADCGLGSEILGSRLTLHTRPTACAHRESRGLDPCAKCSRNQAWPLPPIG